MAIDDYFFKTPGSVPFKWEIRPGVPKIHHQPQHQLQPSNHHHSHSFLHHEQHHTNQNHSSPTTPQKLTPPPAEFSFQPQLEPRTRSVLSVFPRTQSRRNKFNLAQPEIVSDAGCFTRPVMSSKDKKKKNSKRSSSKIKTESEPETDYTSDLETLSRWSVSTRKTLSPFRDSPSFSPFSSYKSSPRLVVSDAEWAGFALF